VPQKVREQRALAPEGSFFIAQSYLCNQFQARSINMRPSRLSIPFRLAFIGAILIRVGQLYGQTASPESLFQQAVAAQERGDDPGADGQ
jgi:hypothetical protein